MRAGGLHHGGLAGPLGQVKHGQQGLTLGASVLRRFHNVGHVGPPALHHRLLGQQRSGCGVGAGEYCKQGVGLGVEEDVIVSNACCFQGCHELGSDGVVAPAVFLRVADAWAELHFEGELVHR